MSRQKYIKLAKEWLDSQSQEYFAYVSPDKLIKDFAKDLDKLEQREEIEK